MPHWSSSDPVQKDTAQAVSCCINNGQFLWPQSPDGCSGILLPKSLLPPFPPSSAPSLPLQFPRKSRGAQARLFPGCFPPFFTVYIFTVYSGVSGSAERSDLSLQCHLLNFKLDQRVHHFLLNSWVYSENKRERVWTKPQPFLLCEN